jgi:hypothetical protein
MKSNAAKPHRAGHHDPARGQALAQAILDGGKTLADAAAEFAGGSIQIAKIEVARESGRREAKLDRREVTVTERIPLSSIRADDQAQPRVALMPDRVAEYIEDMGRGDTFPPLVVFRDRDGVCWLADGFHRYHAYVGVEAAEADCIVREGGLRDAILYSVGANADHGMRRTNADKREAVAKLLKDPEWVAWSNHVIAQRCRVSDVFVGKLRNQLAPVTTNVCSEEPPQARTYTDRHGHISMMNTANIGGRSRAEEPVAESAKEAAPAPAAAPEARAVDPTPHLVPEAPALPAASDPAPAAPVSVAPQAANVVPLRPVPAPGPVAEEPDDAQSQIAKDNANGWISSALWEIERNISKLPSPAETAALFPTHHYHTFTTARLTAMADWLRGFAAAWDQTVGANNG